MTTTVVMQPTFLPWLGYFALIAQADDFVLLDDVQLVKRSWQRRNQVAGPNGPVLLSLPVARKPSFPLIHAAMIADHPPVADLIPRIAGALGKAPHWDSVAALLEQGLARAAQGLAALNIGLIRDLAAVMEITTRFHCASGLGIPGDDKADRLLALCQRLGADTYLSPVGSADYLRDGHPFTEDGVRLRFLHFVHPTYAQRWQPFRPYMSVIDSLAWVGPDATRAMIMSGILPPRLLSALPQKDVS